MDAQTHRMGWMISVFPSGTAFHNLEHARERKVIKFVREGWGWGRIIASGERSMGGTTEDGRRRRCVTGRERKI
jgi:hypothetical protein